MSKTQDHLGQLTSYIEDLEKQHRTLKPQLDQITKTLSAFGFRLGDPLNLTRLPIDFDFVEKVIETLKPGGMNVKTLQRNLQIFDYQEMTRKRKALVAAGVIRETENYHGTNATFIELVEHEEQPTLGAGAPTGEAADTNEQGGEEEITGMEPPTAQAPKSVKKPTTIK
jgi:hypothetical protein